MNDGFCYLGLAVALQNQSTDVLALIGTAAPAGVDVVVIGPGGEAAHAAAHSAANALNHSRRTPVDTTGKA